jgi:hypothetical protein
MPLTNESRVKNIINEINAHKQAKIKKNRVIYDLLNNGNYSDTNQSCDKL